MTSETSAVIEKLETAEANANGQPRAVFYCAVNKRTGSVRIGLSGRVSGGDALTASGLFAIAERRLNDAML